MSPVIDAHVHYWRVARGDYHWMTPDMPIARDFLPADSAPLLAAAEVDGVVLVQAAATEAETRFMLSLAADHPHIRGVVGWVDMMAADAPDRLAALAADPKLRGIRPMWQDIADPEWFLDPRQDAAYRAVIELGLSFDALARVWHLPHLPKLIERHPDLPVVIDHAAKPEIEAGHFDDWYRDMKVMAGFGHVMCKFSGLVTEARPGAPFDEIRRYGYALLELFGPKRLIFGSDWPVVTTHRTYAEWWDWASLLTDSVAAEDRAALFGGNAVGFYRLKEEVLS